jgi:tetratricopeptide (TPR) repeat protein
LGQGDPQSARREFELLGKEGGPYEASLATLYLSRVLMYEGRLREATDSLRAGLVLGEKLHSGTWIPVQRYLLAQALWARGHITDARAQVRQLALAANAPPLEQELRRGGLMAVQLGDLQTAQQLFAQLEVLAKQRDSGYTNSCYYNLKGALELASGNTDSAIESQHRAALFFPSYQAQAGLANAYAARKEWPSAAAAGRRYLEFQGEIFNEDSPEDWVLAHLALARALAKAGDTKQALAFYDEFLRLWAHADPDLLVLRDALAERDRLRNRIAPDTTATPAIPPAN